MKRILCLTAAFALTATAAFGQARIEPPMFTPLGAQVYLRSGTISDAETAGLFDLIKRAMERSRMLHLVPVVVPGEQTMEVEAPVSYVKGADGKRVTVTYEVTPPEGDSGRVYSATCTSTQLDRCADAIAQRAERVAREWKAAKGAPDGL